MLVDDTLLIDTGSVRRSGVPLDRVRTILFTHAHPDHADPQPLLWRQAAYARAGNAPMPLEIAGPPAALELCRHWVGPDDPVTWTPLRAGQRAILASGHLVRALAAKHWQDDPHVGPALLYVIDERLLAAWDTGAPLPRARHPRYDIVLLDCNDGLQPGIGEHHNLDTFEQTVNDLRLAGSIDDRTQIVAVSLGCANPPGPELQARLARVGAGAPPDGTLLSIDGQPRRCP